MIEGREGYEEEMKGGIQGKEGKEAVDLKWGNVEETGG
jgi:hypothetical protein